MTRAKTHGRVTPPGTRPDGTVARRVPRSAMPAPRQARYGGSTPATPNERRRIIERIAKDHQTTTKRVSRAISRREPWAVNAFTRIFAEGVANAERGNR